MPISVVCPGCLKRFQVSDRFAGKTGPCPNCGTNIPVPLAPVKVLPDDSIGKNIGLSADKMPIPRAFSDFDPVKSGWTSLAVCGCLLMTFLFGLIPMPVGVRSFFGMVGLCAVSFPLTLFGYRLTEDREQLFFLTGNDLICRGSIIAIGYVLLWTALEYVLSASRADVFVGWLYFIVFAYIASLVSQNVLQIRPMQAFLHFWVFGIAVMVLRYLVGLGWFWIPNEIIRHTAAPPPPMLY